MGRTITAAAKAATNADHVRVVALVEFNLGPRIRVCSAPFDITWNSYTWKGLGDLGSVGPIKEVGDLEAHALEFTLNGLKPAWVSAALAEHYQGRDARLWIACLDSAGAVIANPVLVWAGLLDTIAGQFGDESSLTATAQSRLARWDRPLGWRFNAASQNADYPSDKGLEFVEDMVEKEIMWGSR